VIKFPRAGLLALLATSLAACFGNGPDRSAPSTTQPPVVLSDVSGHQALVVTKVGDYPLRSATTEFFGLPSPQLALSGSVCKYLTGSVVALTKTPVRIASGERRAVLGATLRVTSLKRPVVLAYAVGYTRMGPGIASIEGGRRPACIHMAAG
jgi:hypothetical protein